MRRFLRDVLIFSAVQLFVLGALLILYPGQDNTYLAAVEDKHRAARRAPPPRILLVGGSSVAFGFRSEPFEEELGLHPVNLGLHGRLGLEFMLQEALDLVREGDVVLLANEYESFLSDMTGLTVLQLLEHAPWAVRYVGFRQGKRLLDQGLVYLRKVIRKGTRRRRRDDRPGYSREAFDAHGHVVGHAGQPPLYAGEPEERPELVVDARHVGRVIRRLNAFARDCSSRGARVFYTWPPLADRVRDAYGPVLEYLPGRLERELEVPVLCRARELVLPVRLFYDTRYHLLPRGMRLRTELVVRELRRHLR